MSKQNKILGIILIVVLVVFSLLVVRNAILQTPPPPPTPPPGLPMPIDGGIVTLLIGGLYLGIRKYFK